MKQYDIAIIGGGPGGLYAYYLAKEQNLSVCLIEANNTLGGQPTILFPIKLIHDYPKYKEVRANDLMNEFIDQIKDKKDIYLNTSVSHFEVFNDKYIIHSSNDSFEAKYIIVATGGGFFKFNKIDGIEENNTHYRIENLETYRNKKVIVCGGGDSAIDWTWELLTNHITNDLSLVHRRDQFRASGPKLEQVTHSNVKVYLNKLSKVIAPGKLEITDKIDNSVNVLDYDYLLVLYGQSFSLSDNRLLHSFKLDNLNKIIVDDNCLTSLKNIYAIGNVSSYNNKPRLIHVAVSDATKAITDISRKIKHE